MVTTVEVCQGILEPHHSRLRFVVDEAFRRFNEIPDHLRLALMNPIARPTAVWSYMMQVAVETFTGVEGVLPIKSYNTTNYLFANEVLVRFKQLDETGLSRNYPTPRAVAFNTPQLDLPDISSSALRVDVGYNLNPVQTEIERVLVSHRSGDELVWCYELRPSEKGTVPLPFPVAPAVPPAERWVARSEEGHHDKDDQHKQATDDE